MDRRRAAWNGVSLGVLLIATSLLLFPGGWRTLALGLLPLIWIGNRVLTGHFVPRTPYDGIILCLLFMVLVSLFATSDISVSVPKVAGVLLGVSTFYVVVNLADTPDHLRRVLMGVFLLVTILSGLILVGTAWGRKVPLLGDISAQLPALLRGLPGADGGFHPAEVGGTLTWIVFLPMGAFIGLWSQRRSLRGAALLSGLALLSGVLCGALILTQSRSAWLGLVVGAGIMLWLFGRWGRVTLIGVIALGVMGVLWLGPDRFLPDNSSPALDEQLDSAFIPGLSDRVEIWSRAIYGIQDFSLTGMGLGTFRYIMPVLYPLFTVSPDVDLGHAHNEWLQAGVDVGLPGLIAFVALQGLALVLAYRAFRQPASALLRWLMAGVLAGLVAHTVFGLTDAVALGAKPGVFFWLLLALTAAVWQLLTRPHPPPAVPTHMTSGPSPKREIQI
jgi:putative inorganic carbon (HCO3(-)) transporter